MQEAQNTIIAGLYLTHLVFRFHLDEVKWNLEGEELSDFTKSLETGELSYAHHQIVADAYDRATEVLVEQFGALQATHLTLGLFRPSLLKVIIQHILSRADQFDWSAVGEAIPRVAERYQIDKLINPFLRQPMGNAHPDLVRGQLNESVKLFGLAWDEFRSTDADYRYANIWINHFQDPASLRKNFYEAGVQPRDDEHASDAVANLMGGDGGRFEAFCVYHSLGLKMAQMWEVERVEYGHELYRGALSKAKEYDRSTERDSLFASAMAAGYPVHYPEKDDGEFADLILRIPGHIHDQERELVNNLIYTIAPLLYLDMADEGRHESHKWRGTRVSANYHETLQQIDDSIGESGWVPLVRLRASKFVIRRFTTSDQYTSGLADDSEKLAELGRLNTNRHPSTLRITYLVDQLCEIIANDFEISGYFNSRH